MKKGKTSTTLVVLALEIASIAVLHAVKLNQSEKVAGAKEITRNAAAQSEKESDSKPQSVYSLAAYH